MENKLGSYINNLMITIVDKEERLFVRKLAFDELKNIWSDIGTVITTHVNDIKPDPFQQEQNKNRNKKQTELKFGEKNENK
tara:strand:- start:447 stop:689 length:243 start_codon:yes stop_codon:yes gene_type:complete